MDFKWLGPYTIKKNLGKGAYLLRHDTGKSSKQVNSAHMKPYFDPPDDTNPPGDEPDLLLDVVSFHHDLFNWYPTLWLRDRRARRQQEAEIADPEGNKEAEITEPEGNKEAEIAEPESNKEAEIAEPEGNKEAEIA